MKIHNSWGSYPTPNGQVVAIALAMIFVNIGANAEESQQVLPSIFLPGVVSTPDSNESINWVSPDGNRVIFTRANADFSRSEILQAQNADGDWNVSPLGHSESKYDTGVSLSKDLTQVLFTSTRASADSVEGDWNIWSVSTGGTGNAYSEPEKLPRPVNTESSECCVVHSASGEFLFASNRNGDWNIFEAKKHGGSYYVYQIRSELNSSNDEWPSSVNPTSTELLISSIQARGVGGDDIYLSRYVDGNWQHPILLSEPINSEAYEDSAKVFDDTFFWSSRRDSNGNYTDYSNVFYVSSQDLNMCTLFLNCN